MKWPAKALLILSLPFTGPLVALAWLYHTLWIWRHGLRVMRMIAFMAYNPQTPEQREASAALIKHHERRVIHHGIRRF